MISPLEVPATSSHQVIITVPSTKMLRPVGSRATVPMAGYCTCLGPIGPWSWRFVVENGILMFFFYDLFMVIKCDKYGFIGVYDIFLVIRLESGFQSFTKKKVEMLMRIPFGNPPWCAGKSTVYRIFLRFCIPIWLGWFGTLILWLSIQLGMSSSPLTNSIIFQ